MVIMAHRSSAYAMFAGAVNEKVTTTIKSRCWGNNFPPLRPAMNFDRSPFAEPELKKRIAADPTLARDKVSPAHKAQFLAGMPRSRSCRPGSVLIASQPSQFQ